MSADYTPAVSYAAKSTQDKHGSIPTQRADCRDLAKATFDLVAEFEDEAVSGYRRSRGRGLQDAMAKAEHLAAEHGSCALIVQHSDRLARGDGERAQHLVELVLRARKAGVTLMSVQDPQTFDSMGLVYAALMGDRNHEDSARKSKATRAGLQRRKERGKPVGAVPFGYHVVKHVVDDDSVVTKRERDPDAAALYERMVEQAETGGKPGKIARTFNAEGLRTRRGKPWTARAVREILANPDYTGREGGYPALIDPERWDRLQDRLQRLDPVELQRRKGGRPPKDQSYILRGLVFCLGCGSPLNTPRRARRVYMCSQVLNRIGLCTAAPIPAELIEGHVMRHLHVFIGSVEDWITERVEQRSVEQRAREAVVARERVRMVEIERDRERHLAEYRKLVATGKSTASIALEEVERIDSERDAQQQAIDKAAAVVSEWEGSPDPDAALDFYSHIVDLVHGRVAKAEGVEQLNRELREVIAGIWAAADSDGLHAEFALRAPEPGDDKLNGLLQAMWPDIEERRVAFPTAVYEGNPDETDLVKAGLAARESGRHTFV